MTDARERDIVAAPVQWTTEAELAADKLPLLERLPIRWCDDSGGGRKTWSRNPDGSEAAAEITRLREALAQSPEDAELVEAVATAMKPELFAGGPDDTRGPAIRCERDFCRGMAKRAIEAIANRLSGVRE